MENLTGAEHSIGKLHFKEINEELKSMCYSKHEQLKAVSDTNDSVGESTKEFPWVRMHLENLEGATEEILKNKGKEENNKVQNLFEKLNGERESLVIFRKENERLRKMIINIQDRVENVQKLSVENVRETLKIELKNHCGIISKALEEMHNRELSQLKSLMQKSHELKKELNKLNGKMRKENRDVSNFKMELFETVCKNTKVKNEILDLKNQLNLFRMLLERTCCLWADFSNENKGHNSFGNLNTRALGGETEKTLNKGAVEETLLKKSKDLVEDDWDWSLNEKIGTHLFRKGENLYDLNITTKQDSDICVKCGQKLEIKKDILSLKKQAFDEKKKNSLKSQVIEIDLNLKSKDNGNLERAIQRLKKKINKNCTLRSEMELLQHRKDLECKQKKYLESLGGAVGKDIHWRMYELFAKERERSKEISKKTIRPPKRFCLRDEKLTPRSQLRFPSWTHSQTSWRTELTGIPFILHPEIKHKLEGELNKSVLKYSTSERKGNCWNTRNIKEKYLDQYFHRKITGSFLYC